MGRPRKDAFDEATTDRVLAAATRIFSERGYARARLEDIAAAASIRRPSLLYHFGSKDKLYEQVVGAAFRELSAAMERGMATGDTYPEKIDATVSELLAAQEAHQDLLAVVWRTMHDPSAPLHEQTGAAFVALVDQLEQFVRKAGKGVVPRQHPVRAILMQLIVASLSRAAMGELGDRLWAGDSHTRRLAKTLLLVD